MIEMFEKFSTLQRNERKDFLSGRKKERRPFIAFIFQFRKEFSSNSMNEKKNSAEMKNFERIKLYNENNLESWHATELKTFAF